MFSCTDPLSAGSAVWGQRDRRIVRSVCSAAQRWRYHYVGRCELRWRSLDAFSLVSVDSEHSARCHISKRGKTAVNQTPARITRANFVFSPKCSLKRTVVGECKRTLNACLMGHDVLQPLVHKFFLAKGQLPCAAFDRWHVLSSELKAQIQKGDGGTCTS